MTHIYRSGDQFFPSVTTILHAMLPVPPALAAWKKRNADSEKIANAASALGTIIHYRILNSLAPQPLEQPDIPFDEIPSNALQSAESAEIMWNELNFKIGYPRKVEQFIVDKEHLFAGKYDLLAPVNNIFTLLDIKTGNNLYESYDLQMGGYYACLGRTPERALLVALPSRAWGNEHMRGFTKEICKEDLEKHAETFLELTRQYHKKYSQEDLAKLAKKNGIENE